MLYDDIADHIGTAEGQCVLLLGPELSINRTTGQYYKSYFKELAAKQKDHISRYFDRENIFSFVGESGADCTISTIKSFYSDCGDITLLNLVARIKFPLVLNVCPDKSLNKVL